MADVCEECQKLLCSTCTQRNRSETFQVIKTLERRLSLGMFLEVIDFLRRADTDTLGSATLLGIVTLTFHAKRHAIDDWKTPFGMSVRDDFVQRAELTLTDRLGVERAKKLLENRR